MKKVEEEIENLRSADNLISVRLLKTLLKAARLYDVESKALRYFLDGFIFIVVFGCFFASISQFLFVILNASKEDINVGESSSLME